MHNFNKKKILILGGSGFVGTNLIIKLLKYKCKIISTYNTKKPKIKKNKNIKFLKIDLLKNFEKNKKIFNGVDYVFMCAANTSGADIIEKKPLNHLTPNLIMNSKVFEMAYQAKVKKLCFISSSTVYPNKKNTIFENDVNYKFFSKYYIVAWMKLFSEKMCEMYDSKIKKPMKTIVVRPSNLYGPYDKFDPNLSKVIPSIIRKSIYSKKHLEVWGDGKDIKDFLYIDDFIDGMLTVFKNDKIKVVNISYGKSVSLKKVISLIKKNINDKLIVKHNLTKPSMIPFRKISNNLIKRTSNWYPKIDIETGLKKTIYWYLNSVSKN